MKTIHTLTYRVGRVRYMSCIKTGCYKKAGGSEEQPAEEEQKVD